MCKRIPIYREENVLYQREEKSGYWTFIPKLHPETRELIVNRTSKEILNLCDGTRSLEEIENVMKEKYPNVKEYVIINDVRKTISSFSRLGIIDWEGENPFLYINEEPLRDGYAMRVAQENDHRAIHQFLTKLNSIDYEKFVFYKSPVTLANEYNEVSLRQKLFAFSEDFFLLQKNGEINGLISIAMPLFFVETSAIIKNIICPVEFFEEFMNYSIDNVLILAVVPITKIKILKLNNEHEDQNLNKYLKKYNFTLEGELRNELGLRNNLKVFSWYYSEDIVMNARKIANNAFEKQMQEASKKERG